MYENSKKASKNIFQWTTCKLESENDIFSSKNTKLKDEMHIQCGNTQNVHKNKPSGTNINFKLSKQSVIREAEN